MNTVEVPDYVELEVTGTVTKVREVMTGDVTAVIDMNAVLPSTGLSAWLEGTYTVEAEMKVPEGVESTPIMITIEVMKNT